MLTGPPSPPTVLNECGVPSGYMAASRGSASLLTGVIGNLVSGSDVPECRWRKAVIDATGSSTSILTTWLPGSDPVDVTSRQSMVEVAITPWLNRFRASVCRFSQDSAEA